MSDAPRVSVIVPALNEEKLLPAMLAQFTDDLLRRHRIELIVSDGGSTDATLAIARSRAHIVVENTARTKQTIAMGRNLGAAAAHGEILVFLNADTLVQDRPFLRCGRAEAQQPGTAGVTCSVPVYPGEETPADARYHGFYNWFFYMMNRVGMGMGRGECHVIPRDVFGRVGGYATASRQVKITTCSAVFVRSAASDSSGMWSSTNHPGATAGTDTRRHRVVVPELPLRLLPSAVDLE